MFKTKMWVELVSSAASLLGHLLSVSLHHLPSVCFCIPISPSNKDTSHITLGPNLMISF